MEQIKQNLIKYLKAMLEGTTTIHFKGWFGQNQNEFRTILSAPQFARLKFMPIEFAEKYLIENEIDYEKNENAIALEIFLMNFSSDLIDANGNLKKDKLAKVYDGIVDKYQSGRFNDVEVSINKILKKSNGIESFLTEDTSGLLYFVEVLAYQDKDMSKFFLRTIYEFFKNINLEFSEINHALSRLNSEEPSQKCVR